MRFQETEQSHSYKPTLNHQVFSLSGLGCKKIQNHTHCSQIPFLFWFCRSELHQAQPRLETCLLIKTWESLRSSLVPKLTQQGWWWLNWLQLKMFFTGSWDSFEITGFVCRFYRFFKLVDETLKLWPLLNTQWSSIFLYLSSL